MVRAAAVAAVFAAIAAACGDTPTAPHELASAFAVVVSNAVGYSAASTPAGATGAIAPDVASVGPIAFVSAVPATEPAGTTATILDRRTQESIQAPMVDGGFDPAGIAAEAGDTLDITIARSVGGPVFARSIVPASRPPRVVRTSPVQGRTDVAINATIAVIFSEPVDIATVNPTTLRLLKDGQPVAGTLRPLAGSSVGVEFVPAAPLAPTTGYTLAVGDGIADLTGDRLDEPVATDFVTTRSALVSDAWVELAPPPTLRTDAQGAVLNGIFYLVGGWHLPDFSWSRAVEAYDPATNTWATRTPVPSPDGYALGVLNGKLHVVGGLGDTPAATMYAYDPATNSWTAEAPMATARSSPVTSAVDGRLYVIGGYDDGGGVINTMEAYDPSTNSWTTIGTTPQVAFTTATATAVGGLVYLTSLDHYGAGMMYVYDPASSTWATRASMPSARRAPVLGLLGQNIYAVGGGVATDSTTRNFDGLRDLSSVVEAYDPATDTWRSVQALPPGENGGPAGPGSSVGIIDGVIYAVIGQRMFAYRP
jgi:hypothetical protein